MYYNMTNKELLDAYNASAVVSMNNGGGKRWIGGVSTELMSMD